MEALLGPVTQTPTTQSWACGGLRTVAWTLFTKRLQAAVRKAEVLCLAQPGSLPRTGSPDVCGVHPSLMGLAPQQGQ